jgi:hypothetical protein
MNFCRFQMPQVQFSLSSHVRLSLHVVSHCSHVYAIVM